MHFKHNPGLDKEVLYDYSTQSPNLNKIDKNKAWLGCFKYSVCACVFSYFSHVWLWATLWTVACQAPLSMGFSRQEYWSGLPCPPQGIFPTQRSNPWPLLHLLQCRRILYHWATQEAQVTSVKPDSLWPCGRGPPGFSVHRVLQARTLE